MIEFVYAGSLITLLGLAIIQYILVFNAKNLINHATFMAARAASVSNATPESALAAYTKALIPLYGGGANNSELLKTYLRAKCDLSTSLASCNAVSLGGSGLSNPGNSSLTNNIPNAAVQITILNPTKESFDDWADPALSSANYAKGKGKDGADARVIPNGGQAYKSATDIKASSGQNIQDANLLKLKIEHGYELKVPLVSTLWQFLMRWNNDGKSEFNTQQYLRGRIPIVSHITVHMHSDAIEPIKATTSPGKGNEGTATDPGFTEPDEVKPPNCLTIGCTVITIPGGGGTGGTGGTGGGGIYSCPPGSPNCSQTCSYPTGTGTGTGTGINTTSPPKLITY
jgi:hypothetical protein